MHQRLRFPGICSIGSQLGKFGSQAGVRRDLHVWREVFHVAGDNNTNLADRTGKKSPENCFDQINACEVCEE